jgi:hypothetical protein
MGDEAHHDDELDALAAAMAPRRRSGRRTSDRPATAAA